MSAITDRLLGVPVPAGKPAKAKGGKRARRDTSSEVLPVRISGSEYGRTTSMPTRLLGFDQALIWAVVALLAWGLVMVYSATIAMPDNPRFARYSPNYFVFRHAAWLALSLLVWFIYAPGCISTLATIKRETGSWKRMAVAAIYLFALAYLASFVTYQVAVAMGAG